MPDSMQFPTQVLKAALFAFPWGQDSSAFPIPSGPASPQKKCLESRFSPVPRAGRAPLSPCVPAPPLKTQAMCPSTRIPFLYYDSPTRGSSPPQAACLLSHQPLDLEHPA